MEVDQTAVFDEEVDYWYERMPDLTRDEVAEILQVIDATTVKQEFWADNPTLDEHVVDGVVKENLLQSYEYHLYYTLNNEAQ